MQDPIFFPGVRRPQAASHILDHCPGKQDTGKQLRHIIHTQFTGSCKGGGRAAASSNAHETGNQNDHRVARQAEQRHNRSCGLRYQRQETANVEKTEYNKCHNNIWQHTCHTDVETAPRPADKQIYDSGRCV